MLTRRAAGLAALALLMGPSCAAVPGHAKATRLRGQRAPGHALVPEPADFEVPAGVVVLHYYGVGGWGVRWGPTYLLTAPYFSHHSVFSLFASKMLRGVQLAPDRVAVRRGFEGTPVSSTTAILIGHGHVDHAGDVSAFFAKGLIEGTPVLIADRSTTNELAALAPKFGCIAPIEAWDPEGSVLRCPVPGVRITPLHHAHSPHFELAGLQVNAFGGRYDAPRRVLPRRSDDYKIGNTWAFLIDLLDATGAVVFRIHYVDAAAGPPHGMVPASLLAERDVDIHIGCVPGFEQTDEYPDALLEHLRVKYVLAGHWEDFFQPGVDLLQPLRGILDDEAIDRFLARVEQQLPRGRGVVPLNKRDVDCAAPRRCGPRGEAWALPLPGETFQFATGSVR